VWGRQLQRLVEDLKTDVINFVGFAESLSYQQLQQPTQVPARSLRDQTGLVGTSPCSLGSCVEGLSPTQSASCWLGSCPSSPSSAATVDSVSKGLPGRHAVRCGRFVGDSCMHAHGRRCRVCAHAQFISLFVLRLGCSRGVSLTGWASAACRALLVNTAKRYHYCAVHICKWPFAFGAAR
jgi:hypothetical protein